MKKQPVEYYDEILFTMVNAGLRKLKIDDCIWAIEVRTGSDGDPLDEPTYIFTSPAPDRRGWEAPNAPRYDILRVKKIEFGESKRFFGTKYTKAAELYVESARYGDTRQIIHPYDDHYSRVTNWYPLASVDHHPGGKHATSKEVKPIYSDCTKKIEYATKADMVDFITFFKEKRRKEQQIREEEEARKLEKLLEEEKRRTREIDKSLDDIWK